MKFKYSNMFMFEWVCTQTMLIISVSTLSAIVHHAYRKKTLVYWRLMIAAIIMTFDNLCSVDYFLHARTGHHFNIDKISIVFLQNFVGNTYPLSFLPTLIYTAQYYELVETVANPSRSRVTFFLRAALVSLLTLCTVSFKCLNDLALAC
jgi:hypothetical protein